MGPAPPGHFVIEDNQFSDLTSIGLDVRASTSMDSLQRNPFARITSAGGVPPGGALSINGNNVASNEYPTILRARDNTFIGNDIAIQWLGTSSIGVSSDFGKVGDPGNNVFRCNSTAIGSANGYDVDFTLPGDGTTTLWFAGNAWDHVPPSQANQSTAPNG